MQDQQKTEPQLIDELGRLRGEHSVPEASAIDDSRSDWRAQEIQRRLFTLMSNLSGMVYRCKNDPNWTMEFVSEGCLPLTGYTASDLLGNKVVSFGDLIHPDDRFVVTGKVQEAISKKDHFGLEYRIRTANGQEKWVWEKGSPVFTLNGELEALEGFITDITDHRRAMEELQRSEDRYRQFMESVPQTIWRTDPEGNVLDCNRYWSEYTGQTPEELKGRGWIKAIHPDDLGRVSKQVQEDLANGNAYQCEQRLLRASDGTYRWHLARGIPVKDEEGKITSWVGITTDIHDQKCAEEALTKSQEELEWRVEERTSALAKANEELAIFRTFVESSSQGLGIADLEGRIVYANPAMCQMLGEADPKAVLGKLVRSYHTEEGQERLKNEMVPALNRQGFWDGEVPLISDAGKVTQTLHHVFLLRDAEGKPFRRAVVATNITERKQAEEALRQSQERLKMAISATNDCIWDWNLLDGTVSWNENYTVSFDRPPESDAWEWWIDHIHPDDRDRVVSSLKEAAQGPQRSWTSEYRFRRANGVWAEVFDRASIAYDASGKAWRMVGAMLDITERKNAENALRASEEKYRKLVETLPDGVLLSDLEGRITYASNRSLEMYGTDRAEDVLGRNPLDFLAEEGHQQFLANLCQALETGHIGIKEYPLVRKDGSRFTGEMSAALIRDRDGEPNALVAVIRDTTERKRTEEALRQSHDQLQAIYDGVLEGLLITDIETKRIRRVNSSMCRMLGYDEAELLTKSIPDLHPPEEVPNDLARFHAAAEGRVSINEDRPVLRKDGSLFYADITGHRIIYQGRFSLLAVFRDITERKQSHELMLRQKELEASEKFARKRSKELAEADQRKDEFLAMLAHELRNPLSPIRNGIDVLRIVPPGGEQACRIMDTMEQQADHLVRLVDDLLDVSRVTRGKLELRRERVALSKIINRAIQTAEPFILANGHELTVKHAREELQLHGDPTRLVQVIANLLNNAAKYTPPGGKILLTTERTGDEVAIRIKDNGIGIAPDMLPHIFETFFQADGSLSRKHGGLGLGLTLVKSLVEMHGGTVEAVSERMGNGSEFTVRLPIHPTNESIHEEAPVAPVEAKAFPCHKILVVDDVLPAAMIVGTLLESFGQSVRAAGSGAEALSMMKQEKPGIVLSDISMPEMDGYELAQEIRRNSDWDDVYLVALTGYGQESDKRRAREAGFDTHVVKPVDKCDLERLLYARLLK